MPSYTITHPQTGKSITITGDAPPSEAELDNIFASTKDVDGTDNHNGYIHVSGNATPLGTAIGSGMSTAEAMDKGLVNNEYDLDNAKWLQKEFASKQGSEDTAKRYGVTSGDIGGVPQWGRENPNLYAFAKTVTGGIDLDKPTAAPSGLADFATRVVPESAVKLAAGAVTAPYHMIKNVTDPLVESAFNPMAPVDQTANGVNAGMANNATALSDFIAEPFGGKRGSDGNRTWSVQNAVDKWTTDPVGALAAVAPFAKGVSEIPAAASDVAQFAKGRAVKAGDAVANKLYDMTLKQGTTLKPEIRNQNVKTALEGGYLPNAKGVDKLAADIAADEQKVGAGIASGTAANVRGTLGKAIANVEALRDQANRSADPVRANAMLDAELARLRNTPMANENGAIPVAELQKMKVEQGRSVRYQQKTNQAVDPFQATIDKARIRGMRQELEDILAESFPELADTNKSLGQKYQLQDVLDRAANRIENNQGIGIGLPIKGGAGATIGGMIGGPAGATVGGGIGVLVGIIEHPSVAPRLALSLYKAMHGTVSKAEAMNLTNARLANLKADLVQQQQTVLDSENLPKVSNGNTGDVIPGGYQQTYDWTGKPQGAPPVENPEALPPKSQVTNLGDELRTNDYQPVHGWEGKPVEQPVANPEVVPPRQSSQMPEIPGRGEPEPQGNGPDGTPPRSLIDKLKDERGLVGVDINSYRPSTADVSRDEAIRQREDAVKEYQAMLDKERPIAPDNAAVPAARQQQDAFGPHALTLEQVETALVNSGFAPSEAAAVRAHLQEVSDYGRELTRKASPDSPRLNDEPLFLKPDIQEAIDTVVKRQGQGTPPAQHLTWRDYISANMARAMKDAGGDHGKAMKLLGEEWRNEKSKDPLGIRKR